MKELTYYEAVESGGVLDKSILLDNPNHEKENVRWNRFKTYEGAKKRIEKAINDRKHQYTYFRDEHENLVDKVSYYDRYNISYEIYKIVEAEEKVYEVNNHEEPKREPNKSNALQEEMPL